MAAKTKSVKRAKNEVTIRLVLKAPGMTAEEGTDKGGARRVPEETTMKLTEPQRAELALPARAPRDHRGRHVVRVQNSLRSKGLVRFMRDGEPFQPSVIEILVCAAAGYSGVVCEITEAGRAALVEAGGPS